MLGQLKGHIFNRAILAFPTKTQNKLHQDTNS